METRTAPIAALRGQLMSCQRLMSKHREAMESIRAGRRAKTCPMSPRKARLLAEQIEELKTICAESL